MVERMEKRRMNLYEIVSSPYCVSSEDAQKVYEELLEALSAKEHVILSFDHIEIINTAFMNTAFGQLLSRFSPNDISQYLAFDSIKPDDQKLYDKVISNAEKYFKDPTRHIQAVHNVLN